MKKTILIAVCTASVMMFTSCNEEAKTETETATETVATPEPAKSDPAEVRKDIEALEVAWADAMNKKDINALMAMYAEDAQVLQNNGPTLVGKAAIKKQQEADFAAPSKYASIAFETTDVYPQGEYVTEVGKSFNKDADGKTVATGKYMAVFVKKDGKYLCIREIYNEDSK